MKLAAVIVNYRTAGLAEKAVASVIDSLDGPGAGHVFVVDNQSGDDSLQGLHLMAAAPAARGLVTVISAPRNGGYGYGNNLGIRRALAADAPPEYFLVLNPDALVLPGSLTTLLAFMDEHPDVGICGSAIVDSDGSAQVAAFRFPSVVGEFESTAQVGPITRLLRARVVSQPDTTTSREVDWISGSSMLIRRRMLEQIGLFDEEFFLYFEEVDLCHRARAAGWQCQFVAGAPVSHVGSAATGMADVARPMPAYWFASRRRYFRKHHGLVYTACCDVAWTAGTLLRQTRRALTGSHAPERPHLLRDFVADGMRQIFQRSAAARKAS